MEIRFATPQDVFDILTLLRQAGQANYKDRPDILRSGTQKYGASQLLNMLNNPAAPIFVAVEEGKVLGYCFCQITEHRQDPVMKDHITLSIDDLCVEETVRGKHIGTQLYQAVCQYARQRHCYSITLNVWACNTSAVKFYEAMGLKIQKIGMEAILENM